MSIGPSVFALILMGGAAIAQPTRSAAGNGAAPSNAASQNNAPPPDLDQYCRRQASDQSGYRAGSTNSDAQQEYGSAYYACMDSAANAPRPLLAYYGNPTLILIHTLIHTHIRIPIATGPIIAGRPLDLVSVL